MSCITTPGRDTDSIPRALTLCVGLIAALVQPREVSARPVVTAQQRARLDRWEVLEQDRKVPGTEVRMGHSVGIIPDMPEAVLHVLEDIARYRYWVPHCKTSRVVRRRGSDTYAVLETDLPWPVKDAWAYLRFTRTVRKGRSFEVRWWMRNGTLKAFTGVVNIAPWRSDGSRTVVTHQLLLEPNTSAPASTVSRGVKHGAAIFVHRLRMRVTALRKFNKMPASLKRR